MSWFRSDCFDGIEKRLIGRESRREFRTSELFRKRVRMMSSAHKTWHHSFPLHCKHRSIVVQPSTPPTHSPPSYKCNTQGIGHFENRYDTSRPVWPRIPRNSTGEHRRRTLNTIKADQTWYHRFYKYGQLTSSPLYLPAGCTIWRGIYLTHIFCLYFGL